MAYESEQREVQAHLDKQAATLRLYRWGSLALVGLASAALYADLGTPAMITFVIGFVYWRDTRNREQSLENARASFNMQVVFATAMAELTQRVDKAVPREPAPSGIKSFMDRIAERDARRSGM